MAGEHGPVPGIGSGVSRPVQVITTAAVLTVALVAVLVSYDHQRVLAAQAGEGWRSWLLPASVDGLVVAASMSMLVRRRAGEPAGFLAWVALLGGVGASLAANVAAAEPTVVGRVVAAWPPLALVVAYELLMQQIKNRSAGGEVGRQSHRQTSEPRLGGNDSGTSLHDGAGRSG